MGADVGAGACLRVVAHGHAAFQRHCQGINANVCDECALVQDPFETLDTSGVGELISMATHRGRASNPTIVLGVCGELRGKRMGIVWQSTCEQRMRDGCAVWVASRSGCVQL